VIVAVPNASAAGVKVSFPLASIDGCTANSAVFVLPVTLKVRICADSSGAPALMPVAHPETDWAAASSRTV